MARKPTKKKVKKKKKVISCKYCTFERPLSSYGDHDNHCQNRKDFLREQGVVRLKKMRVNKLKKDFKREELDKDVMVAMKSTVDNQSVKIGFRVLCLHSGRARTLIHGFKEGTKEIMIPERVDVIEQIRTICYYFDYDINDIDDGAAKYELYDDDFMGHFLNKDPPTLFRLACVTHNLQMKTILDPFVEALSFKTINKTMGQIREMLTLPPVDAGVLSEEKTEVLKMVSHGLMN